MMIVLELLLLVFAINWLSIRVALLDLHNIFLVLGGLAVHLNFNLIAAVNHVR